MNSRHPPITALAVINNNISADLLRRQLDDDGVSLSQVAVVLIRNIDAAWVDQCPIVLRYGRRPAHDLWSQRKVLGFFWRGARLMRTLAASGHLQRVYLVNNDNLLTNPWFVWSGDKSRRVPPITVIAEGIMNYQQIDTRDRAAWRWRVKPILAMLLGLPYRQPQGHLSGAYEAVVDRVVSFARPGLHAPEPKVRLLPFPQVAPRTATDAGTCLIVHTGLWQWMGTLEYRRLADAFVTWLRAQGFSRILCKPHPHVATGVLADLLPAHEVMTDPRGVEAMAADIPAATVVGTCCTALVTLKLMRPDLRCVDFGADFYCDYAYHGDQGVIRLMAGVGVEMQPSGLVGIRPDSATVG